MTHAWSTVADISVSYFEMFNGGLPGLPGPGLRTHAALHGSVFARPAARLPGLSLDFLHVFIHHFIRHPDHLGDLLLGLALLGQGLDRLHDARVIGPHALVLAHLCTPVIVPLFAEA